MKESYRKLFWGLIIVLLDITFNNFDILPDMFGYLLIVIALGQLAEEHKDFNRAKNYATILILLAIPNIFQENNILQGFNIGAPYFLVGFVVSAVGMILNLVMVYYICSAVIELSRQRELDELTTMTKSRWRGYLIINTIALVSMPFTINLSEYTGMGILAITGIAGLFVQIRIISLIKYAGADLSND